MLGSKGKVCSLGIRPPFMLCRVQRSQKRISIEVGFRFFSTSFFLEQYYLCGYMFHCNLFRPCSLTGRSYSDSGRGTGERLARRARQGPLQLTRKTDAHSTGPADRLVTKSDSSWPRNKTFWGGFTLREPETPTLRVRGGALE